MIRHLAAVLVSLLLPFAASAQDVRTVTTRAAFDDVKFELTNAVIARGLNLETEGNIARMLDRTAADVGATRTIYRNAAYLAFCSARYSRLIIEADVSGAAFCPFTIFLYETTAKPGEVVVGYRRFGTARSEVLAKAFAEVEALLDGIIAEAVK
jgi:uncharacterized protein (DUF302 family)